MNHNQIEYGGTMSEPRATYQTIHQEYLATRAELQAEIGRRAQTAEFEATHRELLAAIDRLESQRRAEHQKNEELKEAAWSVLAVNESLSDDEESDRFELALRRLAQLIGFPAWWCK